MGILTNNSLEFAKEHISKFYDSDFFPKPIEFEALWFNWDEVKKELISKNVLKHNITSPRILTASKSKGGFRIVHQLEPLDSIIYTALAFSVGDFIEKARPVVSEYIACSYRIDMKNGSFFGIGSGYQEFLDKTEEHAKNFPFTLTADISDFYNQIYLHRLNNAIEASDESLKTISDDIEGFIMKLNNKASQGIPVGPAASIIMAEATLMDVDQLLSNLGVVHTRYVDDFRIFSDSKGKLEYTLEELTSYLYSQHRLTLATDKTKIITSEEFLKNDFHNPYTEEKMEIYKTLEKVDPLKSSYSEVYIEEEMDEEMLEEIEQIESIKTAIEKLLNFDYLDLGLSRSAIRKAKKIKTKEIIDYILENFNFFYPVINDVMLYFQEITDDDLAETLINTFEKIVGEGITNKLARFWVEWYLCQNKIYLKSKVIKDFIYSSENLQHQAIASINTNNLAWVRTMKPKYYGFGSWDRRSLLYSARILPSDERESWLKLIVSSPDPMERWMANWLIKTSF